jgi:hypothetical protein
MSEPGHTPPATLRSVLQFLALALLVLAIRHLALRTSLNAGLFPTSADELSRLWYARHFIGTGAYDTFGHTWLPLPIWTSGWFGAFLGGDYLRAVLLTNSFACLACTLLVVGIVQLTTGSSRWAFVAGVLAALQPWQIFLSGMAYSENHLWLGLMMAHAALVVLPCCSTLTGRLVVGLLGSVGVTVAVLSRYEAWPYVAGYPLGVGVLVWAIGIDPVRRRLPVALVVATVAALLPVAAVGWWMAVHLNHYGDPLRPLRLTHWFPTDGLGRSQPFETPLALLAQATRHNPLILPLLLLALLQPRWSPKIIAVTAPPVFYLLLLTLLSVRSGIPWVFGERTLGFAGFALIPAAVVSMAGHWTLAGEAETPWSRRSPIALVLLGGILLSLLSILHPPRTPYEKARVTARSLARILEREPLEDGTTIAIDGGGDLLTDERALIFPHTSRLLSIPAEYNQPLTPEMQEDLLAWLRESRASIWLSPRPPHPSPEISSVRTPPWLRGRLETAIDRGDAVLLFTIGHPHVALPQEVRDQLTRLGLQGPPATGDAYRYLALGTPQQFAEARFEQVQSELALPVHQLHRTIQPRPAAERAGLPGHYLLHLQPEDGQQQAVITVGRESFRPPPYRHSLYAVTFNPTSGRVSNYLAVSDDGWFAHESESLPYHVIRLRH